MTFVPLTEAVAPVGPESRSSSAPLLLTLNLSVPPVKIKALPKKPVSSFTAKCAILPPLVRSSVPPERFRVAPAVPAPPLPIDRVWPLANCGANVAPLLTVIAVLLSEPEGASASVPEVTVVVPV